MRRHRSGSPYGLPDLWQTELWGTEDREVELASRDLVDSRNPANREDRRSETREPQPRSPSLFPRALVLCDPGMERASRPHTEWCGQSPRFLEFAHGDRRGGIPIVGELRR
jgi:hypothetical protein